MCKKLSYICGDLITNGSDLLIKRLNVFRSDKGTKNPLPYPTNRTAHMDQIRAEIRYID